MAGLVRRGRIWHFRKRVPARFAGVDPRPDVWVSLHTDSETEARARAAQVERELLAWWAARAAGIEAGEAARHAAAVKLAAARGLPWRTAEELAAGPLDELVARLERLAAGGGLWRAEDAAAELGLVAGPPLTLTAGLALYFEETGDRLAGRSPNQRRKWRHPRERAVANAVKVLGDKRLDELTREDAVRVRAHWRERVEAGTALADTGNRDLMHLRDLWATVAALRGWKAENPFAGLRLRPGLEARRRSLTRAEASAIAAPGALASLNAEAADAVLIMLNTGAGPAEVVGARVQDLAVDAAVPHLVVDHHEGRLLKTAHRGRRIPLLGASLEAARRRVAAGGFPRYADKPDGLSATVNKQLRALRLLPDGASIYSLRHAFQDRLIAAEVPERLQAELMGHKLARPRYGAGPTLEHLAEWLAKAAV